jgi:hypothetical protein
MRVGRVDDREGMERNVVSTRHTPTPPSLDFPPHALPSCPLRGREGEGGWRACSSMSLSLRVSFAALMSCSYA